MTTLQQAVDAKPRVMKHLPYDGALSLIILKGYLLVEELLFILVRSAAWRAMNGMALAKGMSKSNGTWTEHHELCTLYQQQSVCALAR
jgi:hypothetical protein